MAEYTLIPRGAASINGVITWVLGDCGLSTVAYACTTHGIEVPTKADIAKHVTEHATTPDVCSLVRRCPKHGYEAIKPKPVDVPPSPEKANA